MTKNDAEKFADAWIAAWNAHDLDAILSHYDDAIELTSPVAAKLLNQRLTAKSPAKKISAPTSIAASKPTHNSASISKTSSSA